MTPRLLVEVARLLAFLGGAPAETTPRAEIDVALRIEARIAHRWIVPESCTPATFEGWEGIPLARCTRSLDGITADVVLADVPPRRVARWIVGACAEVLEKRREAEARSIAALTACSERLRAHIARASNYEIPVAGIVLEDLDAEEPGMEAYAFRHGVSVRVAGFANGRAHQPTAAEMEATLSAPVEDVLRYARVASTTREEYRRAGGYVDVGTSGAKGRKAIWLSVVRDLLREAAVSDRNELVTMWAINHEAELLTPDEKR